MTQRDIITYFKLSEQERRERLTASSTEQLLKTGRLASGYSHIAIIEEDGTVSAYGNNYRGQCDTDEWKHIIKVAAGDYHTVGLRDNGTVVAVGDNSCGQCNVSDWTGLTDVFADKGLTIGMKADGELLFSGLNQSPEEEQDTVSTPEEDFIFSEYYDSVFIGEYIGDKKTVIIPEEIHRKKVTEIGRLTFGNSPDLEEVSFPNSLIRMGEGICEDFHHLKRVRISGRLVAPCAFRGCMALKDVYLADGVESIGVAAFRDCRALAEITIPESVNQIGMKAFDNDVLIRCYKGSYAHDFAIQKNMRFELIKK